MAKIKCPECGVNIEGDIKPGEKIKCPSCNNSVIKPRKAESYIDLCFGGFRVMQHIGEGGMGDVFLANQISLQRNVAVKILRESLTRDKDAVEQFLKEVRTSGNLQHHNIVTAFDAGENEGVYYMAMTYINGWTLDQMIEKKGNIPEVEAMKYFYVIADALNYAWEQQGLIHKDIKPGNIMINKSDEPFIMDMGIAQSMKEFVGKDQKAETVEGSPYYMSPEQCMGEKLDWHADLYSLGATLYHAVLGKVPYNDPDLRMVIDKHCNAPFPEPEIRNPKVELNDFTVKILRKCLEKDPADRYASWDDFRKDINKAIKKLKGPDVKRKKKKPVGTKSRTISTTTKPGIKPKVSIKKSGTTKVSKLPVVKKRGNSIITLFFLVVIIAAGAAATMIILNKRKNINAENSLKIIQSIMQSADSLGEFKHILSRFRKVEEFCRNTKYESRFEKQFADAKLAAKYHEEFNNNFLLYINTKDDEEKKQRAKQACIKAAEKIDKLGLKIPTKYNFHFGN